MAAISERRAPEQVLGHRRGEANDRIIALPFEPIIDDLLKTSGMEISRGDGPTAEQRRQTPELCPALVKGNRGHALAIGLKLGPISEIGRIVRQACQVDFVIFREHTDLVKGANLIPFVRRVWDAMGQVENLHLCADQTTDRARATAFDADVYENPQDRAGEVCEGVHQ